MQLGFIGKVCAGKVAAQPDSSQIVGLVAGGRVELRRRDSALLETNDDLPRTQPAIDQNPAMIGRDHGAVSRAAAAEHGQSEHASISSGRRRVSQIGNEITEHRLAVCGASGLAAR